MATMPEHLKKELVLIMMAQYKEGMRDGIKVVRDMLKNIPTVTDEVRALIEGMIELATEEAEKESQKLHAL